MKLKKGDKVKIVAGKDRGKEGVIERIFPRENKVLVPGVNVYKKHTKARGGEKPTAGGIVDLVVPLPIANVALICPKCTQATRVGFKKEGKEKFRVCKKCREVI